MVGNSTGVYIACGVNIDGCLTTLAHYSNDKSGNTFARLFSFFYSGFKIDP